MQDISLNDHINIPRKNVLYFLVNTSKVVPRKLHVFILKVFPRKVLVNTSKIIPRKGLVESSSSFPRKLSTQISRKLATNSLCFIILQNLKISFKNN